MVVVAHIPVNVSNIECHGETGHGMEMTDMQGMKHFDARNDVIFCSEVIFVYAHTQTHTHTYTHAHTHTHTHTHTFEQRASCLTAHSWYTPTAHMDTQTAHRTHEQNTRTH